MPIHLTWVFKGYQNKAYIIGTNLNPKGPELQEMYSLFSSCTGHRVLGHGLVVETVNLMGTTMHEQDGNNKE